MNKKFIIDLFEISIFTHFSDIIFRFVMSCEFSSLSFLFCFFFCELSLSREWNNPSVDEISFSPPLKNHIIFIHFHLLLLSFLKTLEWLRILLSLWFNANTYLHSSTFSSPPFKQNYKFLQIFSSLPMMEIFPPNK